MINSSTLLKNAVGKNINNEPFVCDATCRSTEPLAGDDWCLVGEAAFTFDPLSSQGVQVAISTALRAAVVVNTILQDPSRSHLAQLFYKERQDAAIKGHMQNCSEIYHRQWISQGGEFWHRRAARYIPYQENEHGPLTTEVTSADVVSTSQHVEFCTTAAIRGEFVEQANAIRVPTSDEPIVFFGGVEIASFLKTIRRPRQVREILDEFPKSISIQRRTAIVRRLCELKILDLNDHKFSLTPQ